MRYQGIYDSSPLIVQNIMASVYGFKSRKVHYGGVYKNYMETLDTLYSLPRAQLEKIQFDECIKLLNHAKIRSKYYATLYRGIDVSKFTSINDLKKLPIVTKEMLQQNINRVVTIPTKAAYMGNTGGTTGRPLTVYYRIEDCQKRSAVLDHFKKSHGFTNILMKRATFMGKHIVPFSKGKKIYWRYNAPLRQMLYSTFHITTENLPYYVSSLNSYKPVAIDGFFSSIYEVASYMHNNGIKPAFRPVAIFPTAETVIPEYKNIIEQVFNAPVRNQYASSEGAPFVWECPKGNLHYDITTGVIECMSGSNEIVVTSFTSYGTPLIRYAIGDSMDFDQPNKVCPCGCETPLIKFIEGRCGEYLFGSNGAKINLGNIANIFKYLPGVVSRSQVIQNSLTSLTVRVVATEGFSVEHESLLISEIKHKFGSEMMVVIEKVNDIPREKSGKYRIVINNLLPMTRRETNG